MSGTPSVSSGKICSGVEKKTAEPSSEAPAKVAVYGPLPSEIRLVVPAARS